MTPPPSHPSHMSLPFEPALDPVKDAGPVAEVMTSYHHDSKEVRNRILSTTGSPNAALQGPYSEAPAL